MNRVVEVDSPEAFAQEITKLQDALPKKIDANPKNVEKGLAKLVLTLIELIRKLLEKQAMRRIDAGSLSEEEIERIVRLQWVIYRLIKKKASNPL